jgi:hypothetical protein
MNISLPDTVQNQLKTKISELVFNSISDSVIDDLIKKEIDAFFSEEQPVLLEIISHGYNGNKTLKSDFKMSPFRQMVWSIMTKELGSKLNVKILEAVYTTVDKMADEVSDSSVKTLASAVATAHAATMQSKLIASLLLETQELINTAVQGLTPDYGIQQFVKDRLESATRIAVSRVEG